MRNIGQWFRSLWIWIKSKFLLVPIAFFATLAAIGCTPVAEHTGKVQSASPLTREAYDYVLIMPVDKSGSFQTLMKPGGKGLEFANRTITHYFQNRIGNNDYLVVSQLSANRQALLWQGSPRQLRTEFTDIGEWAEMLDKKAAEGGSRVWDGLSDSLEIVMTDPSMWNNHTKVILIGLTDMENNLVDSYTSEQRLLRNLKAFAQHGGVIGLYFVAPNECIRWRDSLQSPQVFSWSGAGQV